MSNALTFQETTFDVIDRNGQPWLQARQIGKALGYSRPDAILNIYERNKDEFSVDMTSTIELMVGQTPQTTRIFSLRGCHLLAMFARTPVAKEFRKWVLDVLEKIGTPPVRKPLLTQNALAGSKGKVLYPAGSAEGQVSALMDKVGFYIKEVADAEKRISDVMVREFHRRHPGASFSLLDAQGSYNVNSTTNTRFLWNALDFTLKAIEASLMVRLEKGV